MTSFKNSKKAAFLSNIPTASLDADNNDLAQRCKFNFSYYCSQPAGQTFEEWTELHIRSLLDKLTHYSKQSLKHWQKQPIGKSGNVLAIYGPFPTNSDFSHPAHVPHEVLWGRFRLDHSMRLVGFTIPEQLDGTIQNSSGKRFDANTFYVVFLDQEHRFWKGKEAK
jgi:hypothetical protein